MSAPLLTVAQWARVRALLIEALANAQADSRTHPHTRGFDYLATDYADILDVLRASAADARA